VTRHPREREKILYPHTIHDQGQPILDVRHLNVQYGERVVLEDINFHLHAGEGVAVVGPNGAGKSTLFKVVAGVERLTSGEVRIFGSGPRGHVCIGYVPQRNQVDWSFPVTVADVVMMGRIAKLGLLGFPRKPDWDSVSNALEVVGMQDLSTRQIKQLSGGQQQRMFIARALAQEAELMLMDEPLTGLDAPAQDEILALIGRFHDRGVTTMMAIHDLEQATKFFDRIMLLNRRLIGFGIAREVLCAEKLTQAYAGRLHLVAGEQGVIAFSDPCCDEGEPHDHDT